MNRIFQVVWSTALGRWVVTSELAASRGKSGTGKRHVLLAGICASALLMGGWSTCVGAQVWKGTTSTDWTVGSNWSTGAAPAANATVTINTNSPNPAVLGVSGAATSTIGALQLGTAAGTSALTIQNGSTLSATATGTNSMIGNFAGANATLNVTGAGSSWSVAGITNVGNNGTGTLNISNGGAVSVTNGLGLAFGSSSGIGTLNLASGGTLTTSNASVRNGAANVSGAGSVWNAGSLLNIGITTGLNGALNVQSGSHVTAAGNINIGAQTISNRTAVGAATITGAGSQLISSAALNIGLAGQGALTVSNGAVATANAVNLATGTTGNATLDVAGGGTLATQSLTAGAGTAQANFDSATLRATASNAAFVSGFTGTALHIGAGGLTLDTAAFNVTAASPFSGTGALTKTGAGTAVLTGSNTYSGGTTIAAGTLQLGNGGTSGSLVGDVANNGTLAFDRSDTVTYSGQISGTGAVSQIGTGTTVLGGANGYTGGTSVTAGTLQIASDANLGSASGGLTLDSGTLSNTAAFASSRTVTLGAGGGTFDTQADLTLSGTIGGSGVLAKIDSGTLTLTGANAYAGGTLINGGTIAVASDANLGNASGGLVFNGGTLHNTAAVASARAVTLNAGGGSFQTTGDLSLAGAIGGTGALTKTDAGILLLTGNNTYGGGTTIAAGTLQLGNGGTSGSIAGDVVNNGALVFDRSDSATLGGAISGSGSVTQAGTGTTVLAGNNSYSGATMVQAGTLLVDGNQSGSTGLTTVQSGATLGGIGTLGGNLTVANGGALSPGDVGAAGALTVNGNLSLNSGAALNYQFGQANTPGGPLNDLTTVNGNLALAGTLNLSTSPGGSFGPGVYRIFSYAGTLTNNGLSIGTAPAGTYYVQTSVAQQVNLINSTGTTLSFWDGPGHANDGAMTGGSGTWRLADNDYWTDASGTLNAPYSNGTFAVFGGTAGTVAVDNANGQVSASGLQFQTNGYRVVGGALALAGSSATIRVGDGTAAGAGMTATIDSLLTGAAMLVKDDLGTLVLTGANGYTGGTDVHAGTLQVASDGNLGQSSGGLSIDNATLHTTGNIVSSRAVSLGGAATINTDAGTTLKFANGVGGTGSLTKAGGGTLQLGGTSNYGGATTVAAGTLAATVDQAFSGSSAFAVQGNATLDLAGHAQRVAALSNAGSVNFGTAAGTTLTVQGNYAGQGGTLLFNTALGGDSSATDRLVVAGSTSGNTTVRVTNVGGAGDQTTQGIKLIDVQGASNGSFALQGDYVFQGEQAVVAGAYAYRLAQGSANANDGAWYLRSALINAVSNPSVPTNGGGTSAPLYQPGVPLYEAYAGILQQINTLGTLLQRTGDRLWTGVQAEDNMKPSDGPWVRVESGDQSIKPEASTSATRYDIATWKAEAGMDATVSEGEAGKLVGGATLQYGRYQSNVDSVYGHGRLKTRSYGIGASLTWYGENGIYVDGQARWSHLDTDLRSTTLARQLKDGDKGSAYAVGVEAGQRFRLGDQWSLIPQLQVSYGKTDFDGFDDVFGAHVAQQKGSASTARAGLMADYHDARQGASGSVATHVYAIANLYRNFGGDAQVDVAGTDFTTRNEHLWGGLGLGASLDWADGRYSVYGETQASTGLKHFGDSHSLNGTLGFRMRW